MNRLTPVFIALFAFMIAGCTPWATYPPIEGTVELHNPTLTPIPQLMSRAITYVAAQDGHESEILFNLPVETPAVVYGLVIEDMGGGTPLADPADDAYHVMAVRVRGLEGEVDLIRPDAGGVPQLLTVSFKQDFVQGWRAKSVRRWHLRIETPAPHYATAPLPPPLQVKEMDAY